MRRRDASRASVDSAPRLQKRSRVQRLHRRAHILFQQRLRLRHGLLRPHHLRLHLNRIGLNPRQIRARPQFSLRQRLNNLFKFLVPRDPGLRRAHRLLRRQRRQIRVRRSRRYVQLRPRHRGLRPCLRRSADIHVRLPPPEVKRLPRHHQAQRRPKHIPHLVAINLRPRNRWECRVRKEQPENVIRSRPVYLRNRIHARQKRSLRQPH